MPDMRQFTVHDLIDHLTTHLPDTKVYIDKGGYNDYPITGIVVIPNGIRLLTTPQPIKEENEQISSST